MFRQFGFEDFRSGKVGVIVSRETILDFLSACESAGLKWKSGGSPTMYGTIYSDMLDGFCNDPGICIWCRDENTMQLCIEDSEGTFATPDKSAPLIEYRGVHWKCSADF